MHKQPAYPPIAITGLSCLSALGQDPETWLAAAAEAEPAFERVSFPPDTQTWLAATMPDYDVAPLLETRKAYLDRHTALLLGACSIAFRNADLAREILPASGTRAGLAVGSAWGGLGTLATYFADLLRKGPKFAKPILFPHTYANTAAAMSAIEWTIKGPHEVYASGNLASAQAIIAAIDCINLDQADVMFAGGCEALSAPVCRALAAQGRLLPDLTPEAAPAPFDPAGRSIVPGEGAAVLLLEHVATSMARGAPTPCGWLLGSGLSGSGLAAAIAAALDDACVEPPEIDAVFVAAAGLAGEDEAELTALREVFGSSPPPLVALAGLQGDCLGAATALHCAGALYCLRVGWLPTREGQMPLPEGSPRQALITAQEGNQAAALIVALEQNITCEYV